MRGLVSVATSWLVVAVGAASCRSVIGIEDLPLAPRDAGSDGPSECQPGARECVGRTPRVCDPNGSWRDEPACSSSEAPGCSGGMCVPLPSCKNLAANCGASGKETCCASPLVAGGTFRRSYDKMTFADSSYSAEIASFSLDRYEITVGRFRAFVDAGKGTQASPPREGDGAHPLIKGSGWSAAWNEDLAKDTAALKYALECDSAYRTFTATSEIGENRPINCITWYEAFAFCAWDGARLPTEAEWNYAASGGVDQREYPWGETIDPTYAVMGCSADGDAGCASADILAVGSRSPKGDGAWGHSDLAGNLSEWTLDWLVEPFGIQNCVNCAELADRITRAVRGGAFNMSGGNLRASVRGGNAPGARASFLGARCAR
ncbi:MAG TPA: SUMF1/EgtB/PvdO family nonheme iron enzyme [Polyangiaceae bacterium]|nr:SUMF1/EgtB/PvdO family nonheme iron enzyme [Polyangiaceae bacterium]